MQFTTTAAVAAVSALSMISSVVAQGQNPPSGPDFKLKIASGSSQYNGKYLTACHSGAALEAICVYDDEGTLFYTNITQGAQTGVEGDSVPGPLLYYLNASPQGEYQTMGFYVNPASNVANAFFGLGLEPQPVSFDQNNYLNVQSNLDDTVTPPKDDQARALYNWNLCQTNFEGYQYTTLNYVLGPPGAKASNPSCELVSVQREIIQPL